MLWLATYLTGVPPVGLHALRWTHGLALMSHMGIIIIMGDEMLFQCPHGLELHLQLGEIPSDAYQFQCPHGLELHRIQTAKRWHGQVVSMPSRAWVASTKPQSRCYSTGSFNALTGLSCIEDAPFWRSDNDEFQCPHGLELHQQKCLVFYNFQCAF